jgi:hypothetical protein
MIARADGFMVKKQKASGKSNLFRILFDEIKSRKSRNNPWFSETTTQNKKWSLSQSLTIFHNTEKKRTDPNKRFRRRVCRNKPLR